MCSSSSGSDRRQLPKARRKGASGSMARMTLGGNVVSAGGQTRPIVELDRCTRWRVARRQVLDVHERVVVAVDGPRVGGEAVVADDDRDRARSVGLDPDRGARLVGVAQQRTDEQATRRQPLPCPPESTRRRSVLSRWPWRCTVAALRTRGRRPSPVRRVAGMLGGRFGGLDRGTEVQPAAAERDRADREPRPADDEAAEDVGEPVHAEQDPRRRDGDSDGHGGTGKHGTGGVGTVASRSTATAANVAARRGGVARREGGAGEARQLVDGRRDAPRPRCAQWTRRAGVSELDELRSAGLAVVLEVH